MLQSLQKIKKIRVRYIVLTISTVFIYYFLLKFVGIDMIIAQLLRSKPLFVFYAVLLSLIWGVLSAQRFKMLVEMMGYKIGIARCLKITFAAFTLNIIIPSKGGDFVKGWSLRDVMPFPQSAGIVILERLLDLTLLCVLAVIGSVVINDLKMIRISVMVFVVCLGVMIILKKVSSIHSHNRIKQFLKEVAYATQILLHSKTYFALILSISATIWLGSVFQVCLLYLSVGQNVPFTFSTAVTPIVIFSGLLPITIGGIGTRDLAFVYFFTDYAPDAASISVALLFLLTRHWAMALIGIPFIGVLRGEKSSIAPD
ncbi:MAG: flippase-like domain-containing protein [Parcubacteria group bacterium]|nr:flippase-like domain-containing protein [Parcubacteria group bacterium]